VKPETKAASPVKRKRTPGDEKADPVAGQEGSKKPKAGQEESKKPKAGQEESKKPKAGQEESKKPKAGQEEGKAAAEDGGDWGLLEKQREEDGKEIFTVERVVEEREAAGGGIEFLVKWVGWEESDNTWEPEVCDALPVLLSLGFSDASCALIGPPRHLQESSRHL